MAAVTQIRYAHSPAAPTSTQDRRGQDWQGSAPRAQTPAQRRHLRPAPG
jgi:hypothetical protein